MRAIHLMAAVVITVTAAATGRGAAITRAPAADVPAGSYALDTAHASLLFRVDHLGFSKYTARFRKFDARLEFDPSHPAASQLRATVDVHSLETDYPFPDLLDFNAQIEGPDWLDADAHPQMTFRSTQVVPTGPDTARIDGELTLRGITKPLALDATYNGGYAGHPLDPHARIGFSAHGSLLRSAYGITAGIPAPGSKMGVSDAVEVVIEVEFSGPPLPKAAPAPD